MTRQYTKEQAINFAENERRRKQEDLIGIAMKDEGVKADVVERSEDFDDYLRTLLAALKDGYVDTCRNFKAWMERNKSDFVPADIAAQMGIFNRIYFASVRLKVDDAKGLFLHLDAIADERKSDEGLKKIKAGDESGIADLEASGVDAEQIEKLKTALILKRLGETSYGMDDIGNGELFADAYRDELRYVSEWKRWIAWDRKRWASVKGEAIRVYAHKLATKIMPMMVSQIKDSERSVKYLKHVAASASTGRIDNMLKEAAAKMVVAVDELDRDDMLFNVQNGTIDCRSGELRSHNKADMLTKISPCVYNAEATAPTWEKFLKRIIADDTVAEFLQTACGYSLTGSVREECMIVAYGHGANGKSTFFLDTMLHCLGDYGQQMQPSVLLADNRQDGNSDDIARLFGVRCAVAVETREGGKFNEEKVKAITGGDRIAACRKTFSVNRPFRVYALPMTFRNCFASLCQPILILNPIACSKK